MEIKAKLRKLWHQAKVCRSLCFFIYCESMWMCRFCARSAPIFFVKDGMCDSLLTPSSRVLNAVIITKIKYKFLLSRLGPRRDRRPTQPRYGAEGSLDHLGDALRRANQRRKWQTWFFTLLCLFVYFKLTLSHWYILLDVTLNMLQSAII